MASPDLLLVTCIHEKADGPRAAKDLYVGPYFARLRRYVNRHAAPWFILSGEHGLVQPEEWLAPYDRALPDTPAWYQEAWGLWVTTRLRLLAGDLKGRVVEIHASLHYVARVAPHLEEAGAVVEVPLADIPWDEHLNCYDEHERRQQTHLPCRIELVDLPPMIT